MCCSRLSGNLPVALGRIGSQRGLDMPALVLVRSATSLEKRYSLELHFVARHFISVDPHVFSEDLDNLPSCDLGVLV